MSEVESRGVSLATRLYQIAEIPMDDRPSSREFISFLINESVARIHGWVGCHRRDIFAGLPIFEFVDGKKLHLTYDVVDVATSVRCFLSVFAIDICEGLPVGVGEHMIEGKLTMDLMNMTYRFQGADNRPQKKEFTIPEKVYLSIPKFNHFVVELGKRIHEAIRKKYKMRDILGWKVHSSSNVMPLISVDNLRSRFWAVGPGGLDVKWVDIDNCYQENELYKLKYGCVAVLNTDPFSDEFQWFWKQLIMKINDYLCQEGLMDGVSWVRNAYSVEEYSLIYDGKVTVRFSYSFREPTPYEIEGTLHVPN